MGFFDNLLNDIASGELDKKLGKIADKVEKISGTMDKSIKKVAEKPEKLSEKAKNLGEHGGKAIDIVSE